MTFNPDHSKQAHENILGLSYTLTFEEHLQNVFNKTKNMIEPLWKLSNSLPRQALVTIYTAFVRPHLDYSDVLYDQVFNNPFHTKKWNPFNIMLV